jgi:glycosyltransferase involved in cell wall biosynthesis
LTRTIAILHYAGPPTVGGVESTIAHHARALADLGYPVRVVSGAGSAFDERVETLVDPLFGSTHPDVLRVKRELDAGQRTDAFDALTARIVGRLREALSRCEVCIVHNIHTLHKNLALTAALARLQQEGGFRSIAWCHDLAWTNAQYLPELHHGYPWDLLRLAWARTRYVTVSEARRTELAVLLGISPQSIAVAVPGVDLARFFRWTALTQRLVSRLCLLDADGILLLPARLTRRKNIALALRVLAELRRQTGRDFRLIVTGPPGPHNPTNPGYLGELLALRRALNLEQAAHFLYAFGENGDEPLRVDDDTMADLYQIADALFFPSLQEGFGIPILEAGLSRLPIFCADIPPFRASGQKEVIYFDPVHEPEAHLAERVLQALEEDASYRLRLRVRQSYRWEVLVRNVLVPLLEEEP